MANGGDVAREVVDAYTSLVEVGEFRGATLASDDVVAERLKVFETAIGKMKEMASGGAPADQMLDGNFFVSGPSPFSGAALGSFGGVALTTPSIGSAAAATAADIQAEMIKRAVEEKAAEREAVRSAEREMDKLRAVQNAYEAATGKGRIGAALLPEKSAAKMPKGLADLIKSAMKGAGR